MKSIVTEKKCSKCLETKPVDKFPRARERGASGTITAEEWKDLLDRYDYKCLCCGKTGIKLTLDHIMPLAMGGNHTIDNAQCLCSSCNSKKGVRHIDYR